MKNKEEKLLLVQYSSFSNVRNRWLTVLNIKYAFFAFLVHEIVYIYIYICIPGVVAYLESNDSKGL